MIGARGEVLNPLVRGHWQSAGLEGERRVMGEASTAIDGATAVACILENDRRIAELEEDGGVLDPVTREGLFSALQVLLQSASSQMCWLMSREADKEKAAVGAAASV